MARRTLPGRSERLQPALPMGPQRACAAKSRALRSGCRLPSAHPAQDSELAKMQCVADADCCGRGLAHPGI